FRSGGDVRLAHPEVAGADRLAADGLQPLHARGLGGVPDQAARGDVVQGPVERVDAGGHEHPAGGADETFTGRVGGLDGHQAPLARTRSGEGTSVSTGVVRWRRSAPATRSVTPGATLWWLHSVSGRGFGRGRSFRGTRPSGVCPRVASSATPTPALTAACTPASWLASAAMATGIECCDSVTRARSRRAQGWSKATTGSGSPRLGVHPGAAYQFRARSPTSVARGSSDGPMSSARSMRPVAKLSRS